MCMYIFSVQVRFENIYLVFKFGLKYGFFKVSMPYTFVWLAQQGIPISFVISLFVYF